MAIQKINEVDLIEVFENGIVQVRSCTRIIENKVQIGGQFNRYMIVPGDDYSQEDDRVKAICAAIQTPEVVAKYKESQQVLTPAE